MSSFRWAFATLSLAVLVAGVSFADPPAGQPPADPANRVEPVKVTDPALLEIDAFIAAAKIDKTKPDWKSTLTKPNPLKFAPDATYTLVFDTNKGVIKILLMPDVAPMHVTNFIYLARIGFFEDLVFHRVIKGFMAQGGDPQGNGRGGPGYLFAGEFDLDKAKHDRPFLLSMANRGPDTDGSQFFITFKATPHLDGKHTIFGEVSEGQDAVKALEACGSEGGPTTEKLFIKKATIEVGKKK